MTAIDVGFGGGGATTQPFLIGPAAVAVPGAVAGLEAAHKAYGRLPWRELLAPATELARDGIELTRPQAHMHAMLDPILRHSDEARRIYSSPAGARLVAGDTLRLPDLAATFEAIASTGAAALYRGERARAMVETVREGGGELTMDDLAAYRVVWRRPLSVRLSAPHRALQPAAVIRRRPDRLRARAARASPRHGRRAAPRRSRRSPR